MYNICVFGGTTEGRELVEFLSAQPCTVTACVVTDYAQSLLPASGHVTVSAKKLPVDEIAALLLSQRFDLVVDATHPYAQSITKSIARACRETGTQDIRLLRKPSAVSPDALYFSYIINNINAMKFEIAYTVPPGCAAPIPQPGSNPHRGILSPLSPRNAACHISGFGAGPLFLCRTRLRGTRSAQATKYES